MFKRFRKMAGREMLIVPQHFYILSPLAAGMDFGEEIAKTYSLQESVDPAWLPAVWLWQFDDNAASCLGYSSDDKCECRKVFDSKCVSGTYPDETDG